MCSLDGTSQEQFEKHYPGGFILGRVALEEFDRKLCHNSRRDEGELRGVGSRDKLAFLIVYLSENQKIYPPLVRPLETGEFILNGGHHRYAISKEVDERDCHSMFGRSTSQKSRLLSMLNREMLDEYLMSPFGLGRPALPAARRSWRYGETN